MIFKWMGCVAIVSATTALGFGKSREIKRRSEELETFINAASLLCNELRFTRTTLGKAFEKLATHTCGEIKRFFDTVSVYVDDPDGITVAKAWERALEEHKSGLALNREDMKTLQEFGMVLGSGDVEGQISGISSLQERLAIHLADAEEKRDKNQRLFTSLGIYTGLLICILLI